MIRSRPASTSGDSPAAHPPIPLPAPSRWEAEAPPCLAAASVPCAGEELIRADELLSWRRRMLAAGGRLADLDWLLELGAGLSWQQLQLLPLHPERPQRLGRPLLELERLWLRHRQSAEPLQYLVGRCPWRDLELAVAPGVLIPRQETELLVDLALALLPEAPRETLQWADLGTGSGCLAVALARALPAARGFAVDRSAVALEQAAANLQRFVPQHAAAVAVNAATALPAPSAAGHPGPAPTLLHSDWWSGLRPWWGRLDLVLSNPPYIPSALLPDLDPVVRDHEPTMALDGGPDGLVAIRAIVAGAPAALAPGGLLLLEHHHDQSDAVLALLRAAGLRQVRAHRDLEGVRRFASAVREAH